MFGYKVTIENKGTKEKIVLDDLDGFIVAAADSQGGLGYTATDFRYHQANYEMIGYAKAMVEDNLKMIQDDFMSFAEKPEMAEQRYWRVMQEVGKTVAKIRAEKEKNK